MGVQARGERDEVLRIRREKLLPVYEQLGDVRERAVTMGKIADVHEACGLSSCRRLPQLSLRLVA